MGTANNHMIPFFKERSIQYLFSSLVFVLLCVFGYLHATKGIDLTDEGFYLSTSMRYSLGDVPFRDEPQSTGHPFDLLVSLVFLVFPDISLLQIRTLGLAFDIASVFILFLFFSRYAPPLIVALTCSAAFLINCGILSPSYNLLSRGFSILALTSYLFAWVSERKRHRILCSALGGGFLGLSVLSYPSQILLIAIPVALIIFCLSSATHRHAFCGPSLWFVGSFVSSLVVALILIVSFGLLPDFIEGLSLMQDITPFGTFGPWVKLHILLQELSRILPYGLGIMGVYLLAFLITFTKRQRFSLVFVVVAIVAIFSILLIPSPPANLTMLSFSLTLTLVSLFLAHKVDRESSPTITWDMIRNYTIVWGFLLVLIYGVTSGNSVLQCRNGIAPLLVAGVVTSYRFGGHYTARGGSASMKAGKWPAFVCIALVPFILSGLKYSHHNIYRDLDIDKLTSRFTHPRLKGIYSTPEKVGVLEDLLDYLDQRVKPKDYFLAYNYIPMLYFLTHTRPAYGAAWARNDWPLSFRERLLSKMIESNRIPEYCVRMLTWPMDNWKRIMSYDERSPLDSFVHSNYYLEHIIYPFEIWHRGKGPKLRLFDGMTPIFKDPFCNWKGPDAISMRDLPENAAPLILQGFRGDFNFIKISGKDGEWIHISPFRKGETGSMWIQFGYTLKENGFDVDLHPGQQVIFIVSARLSDKPRRPALLFAQDKTATWDTNSVIINKASWKRYIVSKKIRDGATVVAFGVNWRPKDENEWLEIKDIRIYVSRTDNMVPRK
jgi:hypothetical protein